MKKALLFSIFVICAAPVIASDKDQCDAVPFTLGKPAAVAPKVKTPERSAKKAPAAKTAEAKPAPAPKPRLYARCDDKVKKTSS